MAQQSRFPHLVALACHDLRTPLATVYGFARTLTRTELSEPSSRYVEMIEAASQQLGELLDELSLVARIESGRFEPTVTETDSLELAQTAAAELSEERLVVSGQGGPVLVPAEQMSRALARLVSRSAAPVVLGEELRELSAAAAVALIEALGGSLRVEDERLLISLPSA